MLSQMALHLGSRDALLSVFVGFFTTAWPCVHISQKHGWGDGERCSKRQMLTAAPSNHWQVQCVLLQGLFQHDFIQYNEKEKTIFVLLIWHIFCMNDYVLYIFMYVWRENKKQNHLWRHLVFCNFDDAAEYIFTVHLGKTKKIAAFEQTV